MLDADEMDGPRFEQVPEEGDVAMGDEDINSNGVEANYGSYYQKV